VTIVDQNKSPVTRRAPRQGRDGFILVVVLGAVMVLSTLLFGFCRDARVQLEAMNGFSRVEQSLNCARAGLSVAMAAIAETNDVCVDRRFSKLVAGESVFAVGGGSCRVRVVDENGLFNVNHLVDKAGQPDRTRIDQMLKLIDELNRGRAGSERISYGIVPALIDWIDRDDEVTHLSFIRRANRGAETAYYRSLRDPYPCANRPVDALDELLRVKGVTPEAYEQLRGSLTCHGDRRININTAPEPVIVCLSEQMDAALAQMIVHRREIRPFESVADLRDVPGMTDNIYETVKDSIATSAGSRYYRVISKGGVDGCHYTIEATLHRNSHAGSVDILLYAER
jgi:type II secretory pathway component PulK